MAKTDGEVFLLHSEDIIEFLDQNPGVMINLIKNVVMEWGICISLDGAFFFDSAVYTAVRDGGFAWKNYTIFVLLIETSLWRKHIFGLCVLFSSNRNHVKFLVYFRYPQIFQLNNTSSHRRQVP